VYRLAPVLVALIVAAVVVADVAWAQAGGGSSDYGGGGGGGGSGGGGGGFGGGGGSSGDGDTEGGGWFVVLFVAAFVIFFVASWLKGESDTGPGARLVSGARDLIDRPFSLLRRRRRRGRVQRVELAAAEAGEDDDRFLPERLHVAAEQLFRDVQQAWDARDTARLGTLLGPELLEEWERRLADFSAKGWHSRVEVPGEVRTEYVGLENREGVDEDSAIVLIEATLRAWVDGPGKRTILRKGEPDDTILLSQYWKLGRREDRWILLSIEERAEGDYHLAEPIVSAPWSDTERLRDETVIERAAEDGLPAGFKTADIADLDFEGDARSAALDLSLADSRFAPDVLEAAARQAVEAWSEAVDGEDTALAAVASEPALHELLYLGDQSEKTRVVVRGPRVKKIAIVALDASVDPATMTVDVELGGRRYVQDRDTAGVLSGSKSDATVFGERWTLSLDGPESHPWRITAARSDARALT
jgi:predicted lipid-binding transport protein (Tim44 family)